MKKTQRKTMRMSIEDLRNHFLEMEKELKAGISHNKSTGSLLRKTNNLASIDKLAINTWKIDEPVQNLAAHEELEWNLYNKTFRLLYQRTIFSEETGEILGNSISGPIVNQSAELIKLGYAKLPELLEMMG